MPRNVCGSLWFSLKLAIPFPPLASCRAGQSGKTDAAVLQTAVPACCFSDVLSEIFIPKSGVKGSSPPPAWSSDNCADKPLS